MNKRSLGVLIALVTAAVPVFGQDITPATPGRDGDDRVQVRLIHAVPNAPGATISIAGTEIFSDVSFKQITPYKVIPKADDAKVVIKLADGRQLETKEEFSFDDDDELYTVLILPDDSAPNPKVIVLEQDDKTGKVRITDDPNDVEVMVINASPQNQKIKVQLDDKELADGVDFGDSEEEDAKVGSYTLRVVDTKDENVEIASQPVTFTGAGTYTIVVMGQNEVQIVNDLSPHEAIGTGATATGMRATTGTESMTGTDTMTPTGTSPTTDGGETPATQENTLMSTMPITSPGL